MPYHRIRSAAIVGLAPIATALLVPQTVAQDWADTCEADLGDVKLLLRAECALIRQSALVENADGSYRLRSEPFVWQRGTDPQDPHNQFCEDVRFHGQPRAVGASAGRSGVLVGPDLVLTAAHQVFAPYDDDCLHSWYFVFHHYQSRLVDGECQQPDLDNIPADNVYFCDEIVRHGLDQDGGIDMLLIRLDRPVLDGVPLRIRRSGAVGPDDRIVNIAHPDQLSAKICGNVVVGEGFVSNGVSQLRFHNARALSGSSGSMLYNLDQQLLETTLQFGACPVGMFDPPRNCQALDESRCGTAQTFGPAIAQFAPHIPPLDELLIAPLQQVVHEGRPGGPVTQPAVSYTLSVPPTARGPIRFKIVDPLEGVQTFAPTPELHYSVTLPKGREEFLLHPGESAVLDTIAGSGVALAGRQVRDLFIHNSANAFVDRLRHVFELGLTEFEVTPTSPYMVSGVLPPYAGQQTYTLSNPRSTAVNVVVESDAEWIQLSHGRGATATLELQLAPRGEPGDRTDVVVSVNQAAAAGLGLGGYLANIHFRNADSTSGLGLGDTVRRGVFRIVRADATGKQEILIPDGDPAGVDIPVLVSGGLHVCDLNVSPQIVTVSEFDSIDGAQLFVELIGPDGARLVLWDHEVVAGAQLISFDDEQYPAPTGALLSVFDGTLADGVWTFHVVDDVPGTEHKTVGGLISIDPLERPVCGP